LRLRELAVRLFSLMSICKSIFSRMLVLEALCLGGESDWVSLI